VTSFFKAPLKRLRGQRILDPSVHGAEQVLLVPPFTPEIASAVGLISPRLRYRADEKSRMLCQTEANAMSAREYDALSPLFAQMPKASRVLEIGPGYGRSVVYFAKKGVWDERAEIDLYDATGTATKYKQKHYAAPPQWPDVSSFCGNLSLLRQFLDYNHITNYRLLDAAKVPLGELPGPYGLIYGFFSIGFHWSLEFYLDDLSPLLGESGVLICTLNKQFQPFAALRNFSVRVLHCREIKKNAAPLALLALSKSELPPVGVTLDQEFPGFNE
jgi:hypothetical protein